MITEPPGSESDFNIHAIGRVRRENGLVLLKIDEPYRPALDGLSDFSHAQVLWWFDRFDTSESRDTVRMDPPFPAPTLGVFALKSPMRPNPIGLSTVKINRVDVDGGLVEVARMDAFDVTPILDIKAYMPSFDRVRECRIPEWAAGWPEYMPDEGVDLDWIPGTY